MRVTNQLSPDKDSREIGKHAVWSVTTAKPGNGVELLRDGREDTYWQSDGSQPHLVNIQFQKKVFLKELAIYCDYKMDESYTPNKISIRAGTTFNDMREIKCVDMNEPQGWLLIPLSPDEDSTACIKAYILQLAVLANHQNGRDTHIRQVKVYGPRQELSRDLEPQLGFTSLEFTKFATVR